MRSARRRLFVKNSVAVLAAMISWNDRGQAAPRSSDPRRARRERAPEIARETGSASVRCRSTMSIDARCVRGVAPGDERGHRGRAGARSPTARCAGIPQPAAQPLERRHQYRAAAAVDHRMDLVEDHGCDARERRAAAHGRQQQRKTFRRGDQDFRRPCAAFVAGRRTTCRRSAPGRARPERRRRPLRSRARNAPSGSSRLR